MSDLKKNVKMQLLNVEQGKYPKHYFCCVFTKSQLIKLYIIAKKRGQQSGGGRGAIGVGGVVVSAAR